MKKKALLSKQTVRRNRIEKKRRSFFRELPRLVMSVSFKVSILLIGMISVSLMFIYLYKYVSSSRYVKLKYVQATGVDDKIKLEMIKMAGLNEDMSLLTINPNNIKAKMEKHPWIMSVELEKRFPHTLVINAEMESPRALVLLDKLYYMNRLGKVFKEVDQDDDIDYPVITGVSKNDDNADQKLGLAANILNSFESETGLLSINDISEIHVNNSGDAMIYSVSLPVAVRMSGENLEEGKNRMNRLIRYLQKSNMIDTVKVIDMNCLDGAVLSFKEPVIQSPS